VDKGNQLQQKTVKEIEKNKIKLGIEAEFLTTKH